MEHITHYIKVEDLETIDIDVMDFYAFVEFKGITIDGQPCFETEQLAKYLGRKLNDEEKEKIINGY